jgi:hypothetical protein
MKMNISGRKREEISLWNGGEEKGIQPETDKGTFSEGANKGQVRETVRRKLSVLLQKVHKTFSGLDHVEVTSPGHVTGIHFGLSSP